MEDKTIEYYNDNAISYFESTINANMESSYDKFLSRVKIGGYILDFGCGSGRDTLYFINHGYKVDAIDGSKELCKLASSYTKSDIKCMNFLGFHEKDKYDGVWACSSLLHAPRKDLIVILKNISASLKNDGIFYTCFKNGSGEETKEGRYFNYITFEYFKDLISKIPELNILDHATTLSTTNPNEAKYWDNYILKKIVR